MYDQACSHTAQSCRLGAPQYVVHPARVMMMINVMIETRMLMKNGFVQKYKQNQPAQLP